MKKLLVPVLCLMLMACGKSEWTMPPGRDPWHDTIQPVRICMIDGQFGFQTDDTSTYGIIAVKEVDDPATPGIVHLAVLGPHGMDSLIYFLSYGVDTVKINRVKKHYKLNTDRLWVPDGVSSEDFEIHFVPNTRSALTAGNLTFNYDDKNRLLSTDDGMSFTYDEFNNLSLVTKGDRKISYTYDPGSVVKQHAYITSGYYFDEMYNFVEAMGWIPVLNQNLRTSQILGSYIYGFSEFSINDDGILTSFKLGYPSALAAHITNTVKCDL